MLNREFQVGRIMIYSAAEGMRKGYTCSANIISVIEFKHRGRMCGQSLPCRSGQRDR